MTMITICPATKKSGRFKLRFRLRDGRSTEIYFKSELEADVSEMANFDKYGNAIAKFGRFNHLLRDQIEVIVGFIDEAYKKICEENLPKTSEQLANLVLRRENIIGTLYKGSLVEIYLAQITNREKEGYITHATAKHQLTIQKALDRYLHITARPDMQLEQFNSIDLVGFQKFLVNEYIYVGLYPNLYADMGKFAPESPRSTNTVAGMLKKFKAFFNDMEDQGYATAKPFIRIGKDVSRQLMREQYDAPVFLRAREFQIVMNTDVPESLQQCKDLFILQCSLGCRISDMKGMCRERICVNDDGVPYFRYVAKKTRGRFRDDTETPLMKFSLEILKKYNFEFSLLNFVSGKSGYNAKISQLLEYCGLDRPCKVYDNTTNQNVFKPLYEFGSSKLCRKTHEDVMVKVQINFYTTGLHRVGSDAIKAYTNLELIDRFRMMCLAFEQPFYTVDKDLNITKEESIIKTLSPNNNEDN